jgi:hypothetical protein
MNINRKGEKMRNILFILSFVLIIDGCRINGNPVASTVAPSLNVSTVQDSLQYTFEINKANFEADDTLIAVLTVRNIGSVPDTIMVPCYGMQWTLTNDSGITVNSGPRHFCNSVAREVLVSHQSVVIGGIYEPIMEMSDNQTGSFVLSTTYNLSLNLHVR